jgi:TolB-like protein/Tfp pilus assembly protein PilF
MNFLFELKRRNVFRAGAFYAACAWLLVQVATQVFPFFHTPERVVRWIILGAVIGFPFWLALAWCYEWTAQGLKRESDLPTPLSPTSRAARRNVDRWIIVMLAAAVVLLLADKFLFRNQPAPAASAPEKSIAVLPFDNLSRDPDNAYFVEGIQDEILTRLAKIADLKVIARSSTLRFQNKGDLPQIAQQLGVAHLVEGSVQKVNDQVRINVQLIKAANEAHLWAEVYDRKLTDIFAVESEIARTIADTLQAKLSGSEKHAIAARPTEITEAHQLYLKGRFFWNKRTGAGLKKSIDYFEQAIAVDPNYAPAYAGVADGYVLLPGYTAGIPRDCYPKAITAAKKALELDDTLAEAHTTLGIAIWSYEFDFVQANREFQRAIELNPNYATGHQQYGNVTLAALGRFDEAILEGKRAVELDPLSLIINTDLGMTYYFARRYDEAIEQFHKAIEIDPNFYFAHLELGEALAEKRAFDEAITECQKARALNDDPFVLAMLDNAYARSGNRTEALKILDQLKELSRQRYVNAYSFVIVYVGLGDREEALRWVEQSYEDRAGSDLGWIRVDSLVDPLRDDARFEAIAQKIVPTGEFKAARRSR